MDYFLLTQDWRYTDIPQLEPLSRQLPALKPEFVQPGDLQQPLGLYIQSHEDSEYVDYLEEALPLLSSRMMKLWQMYEPHMSFHPVVLMNPELSLQMTYHLAFPAAVDILHEDSEWNPNRTLLQHIVLDHSRLPRRKIFKIGESAKPQIVVRLDVAESILRRDMTGITLQKLHIAAPKTVYRAARPWIT